MVNLTEIQDFMRTQVDEDKKRKSVQVTGESIEDALHQAAIELNLPIKRLEYEVLERGSRGTFGMGKKDCILIAYQAAEKAEQSADGVEDDSLSFMMESTAEPEDRDGEVVIKLNSEGAFMKIHPPVGDGRPVSRQIAIQKLMARGVHKYDEKLISTLVKRADGQSVLVGEFTYNPANDAILTLDITDFDMKALLAIRAPGTGGADVDVDAILGFLKNNGVVHGIDEERVLELADHPRYDEPILVAEGTKPINGKNARILYNFEVDNTKIKLKEKNGRVDFREMNLVQNVVEGQALAKKIPAEPGTAGRTVLGKLIPAKDGNDTAIDIGKNVKLAEDNNTAVATINGQVVVLNGKINVEPVYVVSGDVNLKSGGNVIFLGTVLVKGSVDDGFKVKAAGNIEVMGNVGKCELDAEGDIIVHQGIIGKGGGTVKAGKSVWAKFIENANIDAGELVVASDGIINSTVVAKNKIVCQGKRATIVGGWLRAAEEVRAKTLGSVAGSETTVEVGYDPKTKAKLAELEEALGGITKEQDELDLNIHTLANLRKTKKELPEDKEQYLKELLKNRKDSEKKKQKIDEEIAEIREYLENLKVVGKISAEGKVFSGVRIVIKEAFLEVKNEFKNVTFVNEANLVKITKFEASEEDYSKRK